MLIIGYVILLWHRLGLPYNYFSCFFPVTDVWLQLMMMALQVYSVKCFIDKRPGIKWLIYDGIHMHYHSVEKCLNKNLVS